MGRPIFRHLAKAALAVASVVLTLFLLETATRLWKWEWRLENFLVGELSWFWAAFPARYDAELGWAPRPGDAQLDGSWGSDVTVEESGVRSNGGQSRPVAGPPIVAVGDSFTWGAEVADHQTWPARLQQRLGRRVVNGGVFGYGVDQSYLRALQLVKRFHPETLILSFIPDDINRCELAVRAGTAKPYFTVTEGELRKHPPGPPPEDAGIGPLRRLSGYSLFVYRLLRRTAPSWYLAGGLDRAADGPAGEVVTCRLLQGLDAAMAERGIELLIVMQDGGPFDPATRPPDLDHIRRCLAALEGRFLDLRSELLAIAAADPDRYGNFFTQHMTPDGNDWVAGRLAQALEH